MLAVLAAVLVCAGASQAQAQPVIVYSELGFGKPVVKPSLYQYNNHDYVTGLHWSGWGTKTARATGTAHIDVCEPDCASGSYRTQKVKVALSKISVIRGRRAYGCLTLHFAAGKTERWLGCQTAAFAARTGMHRSTATPKQRRAIKSAANVFMCGSASCDGTQTEAGWIYTISGNVWGAVCAKTTANDKPVTTAQFARRTAGRWRLNEREAFAVPAAVRDASSTACKDI
jgi:hypothetical protein